MKALWAYIKSTGFTISSGHASEEWYNRINMLEKSRSKYQDELNLFIIKLIICGKK